MFLFFRLGVFDRLGSRKVGDQGVVRDDLKAPGAKGRRKVYREGRPPEKAAREALAAMV